MPRDLIKKILLSVISFSIYSLTVVNYIHSVSLYLDVLGAGALPFALIVVAVLVIIYSVISSALSNRLTSDKIFYGILIFFVLNYFALTFFMPGEISHVFYFFVIAAFMIYMQEVALTHYANSILTPLQAKSYMPLIYSFMSLGVIVGSLLAEPYQILHEQIGIGWLPLVATIFILLVVTLTSWVFKRDILVNFSASPKEGFIRSIAKSYNFIFKNTVLFKYLAFVVFLFVGLQMCIDFKLKTVLADRFSHESLTSVLGITYMLRSVLSWVISSFFTKRLLFRVGISNLLIMFPVSILVVSLVAVAFQMHYLAVIAIFFAYSISHFAYFGICAAQVISIVPKSLHESVDFMLRGFLLAVALLFFSLVLLVYSYDINLEPTLNTGMIIALAVVQAVILFKVKRLYLEELKENLYKDDAYLKLHSIELLAEKSSKDAEEIHLRRLLNLPAISNDVKSRLMTSLGIIGNYQTLVDLARVLYRNENPRMKSEAIHAINMIIQGKKELNKYPVSKHYLLQAYEHVLLGNDPAYVKMEVLASMSFFDLEDVISYLEHNLKSTSPLIQTRAIRTLATFHDRGIIPYLEPFLDSGHLNVLGTTIAGLWQFVDLRILLVPKIGEMLTLRTTDAIKNALYLLSFIGVTWEKNYIMDQLEHPDPHIRIHALLTLIQLGEMEKLDELVAKMLWLAKSGDRKELEFVLSRYRHFPKATKKALLRKVQQMKSEDAQFIFDAFKDSVYVFNEEVEALNARATVVERV